MKLFLAACLLLSCAASADEAVTLCAGNPAFSRKVMVSIVQAQLGRDHDPALDADTPEVLVDKAVAQGINECAAEVRVDASLATALSGLTEADRTVAWDAYNTACSDHRASKGACIRSEIGAADALRRMVARNTPPGAKSVVQTCQLVMQDDPAMAEWRMCVDEALAVRPSVEAVERCKIAVNYHVAKTGAEAGRVVAGCLKGG